jgi:hypothetical protein
MAIIQISKIQQRSGNIVDLPQLDEAEFGWATDSKRLFIGKTTPNENIEVLTSYSDISFSQISGATGNLDIDGPNVANGQVLAFNGTNWTNRGGNVGGLITLGDVSNVKIDGGAIGYVLETDGTGNLAWTPKSTITAYIENITQANPAVVTTTQDNFFVDSSDITITGVIGMTEVNGQSYYANVLTANTFALYTDVGLTVSVNSSGYGTFPYTTATATTVGTNIIAVVSSTAFTVNDPIVFTGTTFGEIVAGTTYYVKTKPTGAQITISETLGGTTFSLTTASGSCTVYATGGRVISAVGGSGTTAAGGSNTMVQFNNNNILDGDSDFTWDYNTNLVTINGNANVGNLNATGIVTSSRLTSNIATGTAPLTVTSTTPVANLAANVPLYGQVTLQTTGTFYPLFGNATSGNLAHAANANLSFNVATGALSATLFTGTLTTAAQPNITSVGTLTSLGVTGNISSGNANLGNLTTSNFYAGTLTTAAQPNITSVGTLSSLSVTGTTTSGNFATAGNITASFLVSNVAIGTAPLAVTSTTRVSNLNVNYANVADFGVVTAQTTGTFYPIFVNGNITGNYAHAANSGFSANIANGALIATTFVGALSGAATSATTAGTVTTAAQPNITSVGTLSSLSVTGNTTSGNLIGVHANGTSNVGIPAVNGNVNISSAGNANIIVVTGTGANVTGTLNVSGTVLLTTLTTGANITAGSITGNWSLTAGSRLNATYADLAEYYTADAPYAAGTVLEFGGLEEVTIAEDSTARVAGVVSTNPAYAMNSQCVGEHVVAIALQGRVPCKVRGSIRKGDMLVSGGNGFARPASSPIMGSVIGKALVDFTGEGIIEVAVGRL